MFFKCTLYIFHLVIVISDIFCVSILLIVSNQINYMTVFLDLLNDKGGLIRTPWNLSNIVTELQQNNTHAAPYISLDCIHCTNKPNQYRNRVHSYPDSWAFHPFARIDQHNSDNKVSLPHVFFHGLSGTLTWLVNECLRT